MWSASTQTPKFYLHYIVIDFITSLGSKPQVKRQNSTFFRVVFQPIFLIYDSTSLRRKIPSGGQCCRQDVRGTFVCYGWFVFGMRPVV